MPIFDKPSPVFILFIFFIIVYYIKPEQRTSFIFWAMITLLISDQLGRYFKLLFLRDRPWAYFELDMIRNLSTNLGSNLSFPSNHTANIFGAYRYRAWNGSLGETDIHSAYGFFLEKKGDWTYHKLRNNYLLRTINSN